MDPARRREILERIGGWLDAWPDEEPLPEGLDPILADEAPPAPDLATLAAAVAASGQELKIQGKTFQRLGEILEALPEASEQLARKVEALAEEAAASGQESLRAARAEGREEGLAELLEVHDRLARCVVEARRSREGLSLLARWGGAGTLLEGVARGVELVLERLEEVLGRAGVTRFESTGKGFDAMRMRAVDTVPSGPGRPPGTVAETLRAGFLRGDRVLRPADVRVAR